MKIRIAIFSDVHGHLSALKSILDHIDAQSVDRIVFAGDACLFGPRPAECIDELARSDMNCLVGNTDQWILNPPFPDPLVDEATRRRRENIVEASQWTRNRLNEEQIGWLKQLRKSRELRISQTNRAEDDLLVVHANPQDLNQIIFPDEKRQVSLYGHIRQSDSQLENLLAGVRAAVIAYGHLHIPGLRSCRGIRLANISSVAIPGDGDARAKYAVLSWDDEGGWAIDYYRLSYPVKEEIQAFGDYQPPGWQSAVHHLRTKGFIAQVV